jgi:hypothetical protein
MDEMMFALAVRLRCGRGSVPLQATLRDHGPAGQAFVAKPQTQTPHRSCSMVCSQKHKKNDECDGKRPRPRSSSGDARSTRTTVRAHAPRRHLLRCPQTARGSAVGFPCGNPAYRVCPYLGVAHIDYFLEEVGRTASMAQARPAHAGGFTRQRAAGAGRARRGRIQGRYQGVKLPKIAGPAEGGGFRHTNLLFKGMAARAQHDRLRHQGARITWRVEWLFDKTERKLRMKSKSACLLVTRCVMTASWP